MRNPRRRRERRGGTWRAPLPSSIAAAGKGANEQIQGLDLATDSATEPRRRSPAEALFLPRIAVHVIAVLLPEPRRIRRAQLDPAQPLGGLQQVKTRHQPAQRPAV